MLIHNLILGKAVFIDLKALCRYKQNDMPVKSIQSCSSLAWECTTVYYTCVYLPTIPNAM